jgi:hypothetical protein
MAAIIPPNNVVAGDNRHVAFHNDIADVLTDHKSRLDGIDAAFPTLRGYLNTTDDLPMPGSLGDMYAIGEDMALYYWGVKDPDPSPAWHFSGTIRGPQGPPGPSGTIIGILPAGTNPPSGAPINSLWWVADSGVIVPPTDFTPTFVGSAAVVTNNSTATVPVTDSGITTQADDVAVLCVVHGSGVTIPTPSGWENPTAVDAAYTRTVDGNLTATIFTRVCPNAMGNVSVAAGASVKLSASLMVFRNVTLGTGGVGSAISSVITTTDSLTRAAPTLTPTVNSIVCGFYFDRYGPTQTTPLAASVDKPAAFTIASAAGVSQTGSSGIVSSQGAYDLTVAANASRPSGTQDWVKTGPMASQLGAFTLALAKRTV